MKRACSMVFLLAACGDDPSPKPTPLHLPLIGQIVKESVPEGFKTAGPSKPLLQSSRFKDTFFDKGPTSVFNILDAVDERIVGFNNGSAANYIPCVTQAPVAYTITAMGETVTMYAQCYDDFGNGQFIQFGVKDGVTYLFVSILSPLAAISEPDPAAAGKYTSKVYLGIGADGGDGCPTHTWYGCSHGAIHLRGSSATKAFEMTTAGLGFQYCGAHLKSDGTNVYGIASLDGGDSCQDVDTLCVLASDVKTAGTCGAPLKNFDLQALGRRAGTAGPIAFAASKYPAAPTLVFDGTKTDAVNFGPTVPTPGTGNFREFGAQPDAGP